MNRILTWVVGGLVAVLVIFAVVAPIGPVPGFFIGGEPSETPSAWPATDDIDEILLKVPGALPRTVIIWMVDYEGELYVVGAEGGGWVSMIGDESPVQMRLEGRTYDLTARRVQSGWEPMVEAYKAKYETDYPDIVAGFPSVEEAAGVMALFRLERG